MLDRVIGIRFARLVAPVAVGLLVVTYSPTASAAPRAFYFKAVWAQTLFTTNPENNAALGNPTSGVVLDGNLNPVNQPGDAYDGVIIYGTDDTANEVIDITLEVPPTAFCDTCDPTNQNFYIFPGPVNTPEQPLGLDPGIGGVNFTRISKLTTPEDDDIIFPRAQASSGGAELDPMLMKVANDFPNPLGPMPGFADFWDGVSLVDHMDASATGAGAPHRWEMFFTDFSTGTTVNSTDVLPSLDLDDFNPGGHVWAAGMFGSQAFISETHPFVPGELREIPFGDGNLNGMVGPEDYTIWANGFGTGDGYGTGVTDDAVFIDGDFSINGLVGPEDYTIWANNFGQDFSIPTSAEAVPEPSSAGLGAICVCSLLLLRRRDSANH